MLGADDDAGRLEADVGAMGAEVALGGCARVGVDVDGVVGASLQAGLAADADVAVELDDAVGALVHRGGGADRARRAGWRSGCSA